jgi:hypothetical protein
MPKPTVAELVKRLQEIHLEQRDVIDTLQRTINNDSLPSVVQPAPTFKPGDRVKIINKLGKSTRTTTKPSITSTGYDPDRVATVISVSGTRINLLTDSGCTTWRVRKNIVKLST